jgi:plastocyanin
VTISLSNNHADAFVSSSNVLSPLQQSKLGVPSRYVECNEGLQLIIKSTIESPACVNWEHGKKLLKRGWAESIPIISNSVCDSKCAEKYELQGYTCYLVTQSNNFCTNKFSEKISEIVIPYGANSPDGKNYIPHSVVVLIGVNNTIKWTNLDTTTHSIIGDNKSNFHSPSIFPNQTWTHVFNDVGEYGYHGAPGPWLRGKVSVFHIDASLDTRKPIEVSGGEPFVERYIFRETDTLGYVTQISIFDSSSILVSLSYPYLLEKMKIEIGDKFIATCSKSDGFINVGTFILEQVNKEQKSVQFRKEADLINKKCDDLFMK